jgi:alkylated DNA repair dioxygenase AlkB
MSTQTVLSFNPAANFVTFSAKTCTELIPRLTPEQLDYEVKFNRDVLGRTMNARRSSDTKTAALEKVACSNIVCELNDIFYDCIGYQGLITNFSRSIEEAQSFINQLKQRADPDEEDSDLSFFDAPEEVTEVPRPTASEFSLPEPVRFLKHSFNGLTIADVCKGVTFTKFGRRQVAHFGDVAYRYGKTEHPSCPYPADNHAFDFILKSLRDDPAIGDPDLDKSNYTCLVTLYSNGRDNLAFHSDNEPSIVPGSTIYTVSVGQRRPVVFQNIVGPLTKRLTYPMEHGSIHIMSQASQSFWAHSIPATDDPRPRVSLTFRRLQKAPPRPVIPPISQPDPIPLDNSTRATPGLSSPKRLHFLSDSIHLTFPTEIFDNPDKLVCVKKEFFQLNSIDMYESEFAYSDYVFISSGVNDLSRYKWQAGTLFRYVREKLSLYRRKYPNTVFIFNSLLTTDSSREWLNVEINKLNHDMFQLSLDVGQTNLWFFDSHHIALTLSRRGTQIIDSRGGGVHITPYARREIASVIFRCINGHIRDCTDIKHLWPIRVAFRHLASRARARR